MALPTGIRLHPWASSYEGLLEGADEEDEAPGPQVDPGVERPPHEWCPLQPEAPAAPAALLFVDGVRRIEVGVVAQGDDRPAWGLFGSYGAGAVLCRPGRATVMVEDVRRALVLAVSGQQGQLEVPAGSIALRYWVCSIGEGKGQKEVRQEVQHRMRQLEAEVVAGSPARLEDGALVVVDGPLTFLPRWAGQAVPVVGLVKTHHRRYLEEPSLSGCIAALAPGERTPIFLVLTEREADRRFSWYVRVAGSPPLHHPLVGIVRLETWAQGGLDLARRLADITARMLPRFAPPGAWDARAPANLYPVAALEERLRHGLGDYQWVRRSIEAYFYRQGGLS
ncbi:MAG TPA: DNA double-strand break repair nuclease NurA [Dehalococcoidia bacterium]|nr:DNA double-strand break repair nuclease NurA [Dehalococcoidia bacterium]